MTFRPTLAILLAGAACAVPLAAGAQTIPYGDAGDAASDAERERPRTGRGGRVVDVVPYIDVAQVVVAELSPGSDVVTYSQVAAGVDASVQGRNNQGAVSVRYERRIGWEDDQPDGDTISGIARASAAVIPQTLTVEGGAMAARSRIEAGGASVLGPLGDDDAVSQVYAVYAGPSLTTRVGDVAVEAAYRLGYNRVESPDAFVSAPGQQAVDVFDESTVHAATLHAGTRAGEVLPIGIGVGAGYQREDISNLDQRVTDFAARADVTIPVSMDLALVGGIGYEDVEVSSRDALRDAAGNPVIGADGRFATDPNSPRQIAYDVSGLIWDAGVMWRPSRRTALEAHVGRRYGSTTYYGSFAYAPNSRSSFNVSVYDAVSGFGGQLNRELADLPTDFEAIRNPITGDLTGCVSSLERGSCVANVFGSVRSATFRGRGVNASYAMNLGRIQAGVGAGYDRRKFIAAPSTVLGVANGLTDETWWLAGSLGGRVDRNSSFATNIYASWFDSEFVAAGDTTAYGASAAYNRNFGGHISGTAAVGIDGISRETIDEDFWTASALVGLRYSF
jgi:hypothetical protein